MGDAQVWAARDVARELPRLDDLRGEVAAEGEALLGAGGRGSSAPTSPGRRQPGRLPRAAPPRPAAAAGGLMPLGLSSLGRLEGRVLTQSGRRGRGARGRRRAPTAAPLARPRGLLPWRGAAGARRRRAFGPAAGGAEARILVTCRARRPSDPGSGRARRARAPTPSGSTAPTTTPAPGRRMIGHLRAAAGRSGRRLRVLMDLGGPKIRTGDGAASAGSQRLHVGDRLLLVAGAGSAPGERRRSWPSAREPAVLDRLPAGRAGADRRRQARRRVEAAGRRTACRCASTHAAARAASSAREGAQLPRHRAGPAAADREGPGRPRLRRAPRRPDRLRFVQAPRTSACCRTSWRARRPRDWRGSASSPRSRRRARCATCRRSSSRPPAGSRSA